MAVSRHKGRYGQDVVEIRNNTGQVIQRSRNLRGLREFTGKNGATLVEITGDKNTGGVLKVTFWGATCETPFASFVVLCESLKRWRNLYGTPLRVNGQDADRVGFKNEAINNYARF